MAKKRINLGCGRTKLDGFINIDVNEALEPDMVHNFITEGLPFEDGEIYEVALSHVIEHIPSGLHGKLFSDIHRVLDINGGSVFLAYPEFIKVAQNYIDNHKGERDYWKATIYGRQSSPYDFHVALMDTENSLIPLLENLGFGDIKYQPQDGAEFNTLLRAYKVLPEIPTLDKLFKDQEARDEIPVNTDIDYHAAVRTVLAGSSDL